MLENYRSFDVIDPFGQNWRIRFLWQQNAISIRHADGVDVKFLLDSSEAKQEKVVHLPHPLLLDLSRQAARPLTDAWVSRLAAAHLRQLVQTGQDMDKTLVTPSAAELESYREALDSRAPALR
jgi:hypothetical protein